MQGAAREVAAKSGVRRGMRGRRPVTCGSSSPLPQPHIERRAPGSRGWQRPPKWITMKRSRVFAGGSRTMKTVPPDRPEMRTTGAARVARIGSPRVLRNATARRTRVRSASVRRRATCPARHHPALDIPRSGAVSGSAHAGAPRSRTYRIPDGKASRSDRRDRARPVPGTRSLMRLPQRGRGKFTSRVCARSSGGDHA